MSYDEVDRELERAELDASSEQASFVEPDIEQVLTAHSASSPTSEEEGSRRPSFAPIDMNSVSTRHEHKKHPMELGRIHTQRLQHILTVGHSTHTQTRDSKNPLPPFGAGKGYPPPLPAREEYVVEFDGPHDPLHPHNWPVRRKVLFTAMLTFNTWISSFGSSIFSTAIPSVSQIYGVSHEVGILGVSLYVLGFATGPLVWAPLSELQGRRLPIWASMLGFTLFSFATATGKDLQTILICRFFGGFCAAGPLAIVAAVFSDMYGNNTRGVAVTFYAMGVFMGPFMAPFIGGFIVTSYLGWRWTEYLVGILCAFALCLDVLFFKETYPPVILIEKAAELRRRTLNWGIHAKQEEIEVDFRELITKNFTRPMRLLVFEPLVGLLSIYTAFIYGLLYLFLTAYPLVFEGVHGFAPGTAGLAFFGLVFGQLFGGFVVIIQQPSYQRKLAANNGIPIPEWRLPNMIAGGIAFSIGLFWFGWTGYKKDILWIAPVLSGLFTGFGIMSIILQSLNYLIDAYLMFAASTIAANTFLRSLAGAGFPLFATPMFNNLGIEWASTLLGLLAAVLVPIPIAFYKWGHLIRAKSKFAPKLPTPSGPPSDAASGADSGVEVTRAVDGVEDRTGFNGAAGAVRSKDEAAEGNGV